MGKYNSDAENEVYRFIKILVVVVILVVGFYFLTNSFVSKNKSNDKETTETEISRYRGYPEAEFHGSYRLRELGRRISYSGDP